MVVVEQQHPAAALRGVDPQAQAARQQAEPPSMLSPALAYGLAVVLGVFAAFGFSPLVIVIAEVSSRG